MDPRPQAAPGPAAPAPAATATVDDAGGLPPESAAPPTTRHLPALDGIRAVAIVLVLLFHHGIGWAGGGYLGVDLFFVLSGFLIAGKLLDEHDRTGSIDLRAFWAGRFRRLLPALVFVLFGVVAFMVLVADPAARSTIRGDTLASLFYVANWRFILDDVGYFASTATPSPVRHLWSLSVEEQFYLLFPLLLVGLARVGRVGRRLVVPIALLALASTVWTGVLARGGAEATRLYEGTDTRLATILLGVLAALVLRGWTRPPAWLATAATAAAVVGAVVVAIGRGEEMWMYPTGQLVFAVAAALVIVGAAALPETRTAAVLGRRPLVLIGTLSYGIYLWHWPIYLVLTPTRTGFDGPALLALRVVASVAMAVISFTVVEQPIRHRRTPLVRPALLSVVAVAAVAGLTILAAGGAPAADELRARTGPAAVIAAPAVPADLEPLSVPPGVDVPPAAPADRPLRVALVGDSTGASLDFYRPTVTGLDLRGSTTIGCGVMAPAVTSRGGELQANCAAWQDKWREAFRGEPDVVVMVLGAWEIVPHWLGEQALVPDGPDTDPATTAYVDARLDDAVALVAAETDARIAALELPCGPAADLGIGDRPRPHTRPEVVDWFNDRLQALAERNPGLVSLISVSDRLCPDGEGVDVVDGVEVRNDGIHWTEAGTPFAWEWMLPQVYEIAYRPIA